MPCQYRHYTFELRSIDTVIDVREIKLDAKPLAKPDMYEFNFAQPVNDGIMLHVRYGNFFNNNFGVIMLGKVKLIHVRLGKGFGVKLYFTDINNRVYRS